MLSLFDQNHSFVLLTSPPASGKTSYLLHLLEEDDSYLWVFVSPLKALAEEFLQRVETQNILVMTAESLLAKKYDSLYIRDDVIFVLDEFHLVYLWGHTFRQGLLDCWHKIASSNGQVLALTATYSNMIEAEAHADILRNFNQFIRIDCGNQQLKKKPVKVNWIPSKQKQSWHKRIELEILKLEGCILIFVEYRSQVDYWVDQARELGFISLGCKGGEVQDFCERLSVEFNYIQVIVSTSCLSHGVNLPPLRVVLITHDVSESFWIQMVARAGRRGEDYRVVSCKRASESFLFSWIGFLLSEITIRIQLCFLREFSSINKYIKNVM